MKGQTDNCYCAVCGHVDDHYEENTIINHKDSPKHIFNLILKEYKDNKRAFAKNRDGISIIGSAECKPFKEFPAIKIVGNDQQKIRIYAKPEQEVEFSFDISNVMKEDDFLIIGIQLGHPQPQFVMNDHPYVFGEEPHALKTKCTVKDEVKTKFSSMDIGEFEMPIIFTFHRESIKKNLIIIREMVVNVQEINFVRIFEKSPYTGEEWEKHKTIAKCYEERRDTEYKVPPLLKKVIPWGLDENALEQLNVSDEEAGHLRALCRVTREIFEEGPTLENYMQYFHHLLWWEEVFVRAKIKKYNMSNVTVEKRGLFYALQVPGLAEKRPSLLRGDFLYIRTKENVDRIFEGKINDITDDNEILISGVDESFNRYYSPKALFDVRFLMNRLSLERQHVAVHSVFTCEQMSRIFPELSNKIPSIPSIGKFYNKLIGSNTEQRTAVEHIVAKSSGSAPYIVFGPPGTGKTMTIVEAIIQLVVKSSKNRVMVCTDSNMAADHIALMLVQYNKELNINNFILRASSKTREWSVLPPALHSVSNGSSYKNWYPVENDYAAKHRIFVTTLLHAAKYKSRRPGASDAIKITHMFIDEAAQSSEPAVLVPITTMLSRKGQLVLAGDPQQLGPVVISKEAKQKGLGLSLLQRLMTTYPNLYNNTRYLTMLVKNYRSDPDILKLPNELFYEERLQPLAPLDPLSKVSVLGLPGGDSAVVFHALNSKEQRMGEAPSYYNDKELEMVQKYTNALVKNHKVSMGDIGIITPYIRQVYKVKNWLSDVNYNDIEVGTVESFQGKEKRVILVTTVRANCRLLDYDAKYNIGFLVDDKRYNVTLTRAKAKLIIIGNPTCLARDEKWRKFMDFCKSKKCYHGFESEQLARTTSLLMEIVQTRFGACGLTDALKLKAKERESKEQRA